jgi:hypothetical protein
MPYRTRSLPGEKGAAELARPPPNNHEELVSCCAAAREVGLEECRPAGAVGALGQRLHASFIHIVKRDTC